jgi:hypothetical protein
MSRDLPLERALRAVERLIAERLSRHQAESDQPEMSPRRAKKLRIRADELGKLLAEIRAARHAGDRVHTAPLATD